MATVQELSDALAHVNTYLHDTSAWMKGLNEEDIRTIKELLHSDKSQWSAPGGVPDTLVGALRNQHPDLFSHDGSAAVPPQAPPPPAPAPEPGQSPPAPAPGPAPAPAPGQTPPADGGPPPSDPSQQGAVAAAVKKLEDSLKKQNSQVADADRSLAEAVLNAHANVVAGQQKLASMQQSIEDAVSKQTALDTPVGAREFSKFLLSKQKDLLDLATNADLDDKSKTAILAGLAYLNGSALSDPDDPKKGGPDNKPGDPGNGGQTGQGGGGGAGAADPGAGAGAGGPGNDAGLTDPLSSLLSDPGLGGENPLGGLTSGLGSMIPSMGGGGLGGIPGMFGGGGSSPGSGGLSDPLDRPNDHHGDDRDLKSLLDPGNSNDSPHEGGHPGDKPDSPLDPNKQGDKPNNDNPTPGAPVPGPLAPPAPAGSGPTQVQLPNGQTVTAPNPQMANVTKLVAQGTPIADAFHQNGMAWPPPPGAPVHTPTDPSRITMGTVGQFADHQVYAINKDLVVINGQIKPISEASGPGFLGWMPPPDVPTAPAAPPTITTSAVTPTPGAPSPAGPAATQPAPSNLLTPLVHK